MVRDRATMIVEVFNEMGHDAQAIGERDLALGKDELIKLASKAKFPFLASNLVDAASQKVVFKERVIVKKDGVNIGVFALLSPMATERTDVLSKNGLALLDMNLVARTQVAALKTEGADVIVCLGHIAQEEASELARSVIGITAILGTHSQSLLRYPNVVGNTYITDAFSKAKYFSALTLMVRDGEKVFTFADPNRRAVLEGDIQEIKTRIESRQQAIKDMEKNNPGAVDSSWFAENLKQSQEELAAREAELKALPEVSPDSGSFVTYEYPALSKEIADHADVLAKVNALKEKYPYLKTREHH
ncbi:MAG: hypothetical protein HUU55_13645 [Myxococcales bacterium]|nr:hypothetical protein [Myxococcales bacterium]